MSIGNQLKKARQKKQVTLKEVYQQTRIHPNVLSALEEDRFEQILNTAYVRSFLKEYLLYLGLDTEKVLAEYDKLYPAKKLESQKQPSAQKKPFPAEIDWAKFARPLGVTAASILGIIILAFLVRGTLRIISNISQPRPLTAKPIDSAKMAEPVKTVAAKEKAAQKKIPRTQPQAVSEKPAPSPEKVSIPAGEKLNLTITATDDVWLQLKVDGKVIFQNVLKKGSREQWSADNKFSIWTGKAAAMQLNLNGNDLGSPGRGVMRDITITREGIKRKG